MFTAEDVVTEARDWIGTPYIHQQRTKGAATDCIGLIYGLYQHFVGNIPKKKIVHYSPWWAEEGNKEAFKMDWERKGVHALQFEFLCDMILSVPVYSLGFQTDEELHLEWLPKLVAFCREAEWFT